MAAEGDPAFSVRTGLLRRGGPPDGGWLIGSLRGGATFSERGLVRRGERLDWSTLERLELVVEPPPFKHWWSWALSNALGLIALSGYASRYGHIRLQVLKRGSAFQAVWKLGRTPTTYDESAAEALVTWVAALTNDVARPRMLADGPPLATLSRPSLTRDVPFPNRG